MRYICTTDGLTTTWGLLRVCAELHARVGPADELPPEKQQAAAEAHLRWLQRQPLLARLFTSQQQEDAIRALTQLPAAAAAADAEPNGAEVEMQLVAADSSSTTADPDVITLKRDMLRVEALVADALQVRVPYWQHPYCHILLPAERLLECLAAALDVCCVRQALRVGPPEALPQLDTQQAVATSAPGSSIACSNSRQSFVPAHGQ